MNQPPRPLAIWFAFIGWLLVQAARASYQELQARQMLRGSRRMT